MLLLNEALPNADLNQACVLAALIVLGRLIEHSTAAWFPSSFRMGYDITLNWVLAKWADMPLADVMDLDTLRRFRTMVDIVTSAHFSARSYPVFIELVSTVLNLCFVFGFAVYLSANSANSTLSALLPLIFIGTLLCMGIYRLLSKQGYLDVEKRWLAHDGELVVALDDFVQNRVVQKTFHKSQAEHEHVRHSMVAVRDVGYTAWATQEAHGKRFTWLLWLVEAVIIFSSPILTEVFAMEVGTLLAIISTIGSLNSTCTSLIDTMEKLDVAELLLSLLARVLNDSKDWGGRRARESALKMTCIRRAVQVTTTSALGSCHAPCGARPCPRPCLPCVRSAGAHENGACVRACAFACMRGLGAWAQEVGKDELMIEFHRVRYASRDLTNQHGGQVPCSPRAPPSSKASLPSPEAFEGRGHSPPHWKAFEGRGHRWRLQLDCSLILRAPDRPWLARRCSSPATDSRPSASFSGCARGSSARSSRLSTG